jgi:hypothetical protein
MLRRAKGKSGAIIDKIDSGSGVFGNQRGVIFIAVVLAVAVLLVLVVSVSALASGETRATPFWRDRGAALYVAESGLNHCLWKIKFEGAIIAPREGVYPSDPPTFTNSSEDETKITVDGQVQDAISGVSSYEVWVKTNPLDTAERAVTVLAEVNDQTYLLKATLHQVNTPFEDPDGDGIGYSDPDTTWSLPPDTDGVDNITLRDEPVILSGGTYVIDYLDAAGLGNLIFTGDAVVWVRNYIKCAGTGTINPDGGASVPPDERHTVVFYLPPVEGATVDIIGTTTFNAFIYAPTAKIKVSGTSEVYGCLVGESIKAQGATSYNSEGGGIGFPVGAVTDWSTTLWGQ